MIVGFPGETENDFLDTYSFLNELDISYLHVFTYSERANTDAIGLEDAVSKEKRVERSKMLHILSDKKQRSFNEKLINTIRPVLFENIKKGRLTGHTDNYVQVCVAGKSNLINTIHHVKLTVNQGSYMEGRTFLPI